MLTEAVDSNSPDALCMSLYLGNPTLRQRRRQIGILTEVLYAFFYELLAHCICLIICFCISICIYIHIYFHT
jgi:hypothetical protein